MPTPNELTAWLSLIPLFLVGWGLWGMGTGKATTTADWFARAILITFMTIASRLIYWDVIRGSIIIYRPDLIAVTGVWGNLLNSGFNLFLIYACICMLRGILLSIPENERSEYNWFTAAFYPRKWRNKL